MSKFFVKESQIKENICTIIGDDVKHISRVLRMKEKEELQVCNEETGESYIAEIAQVLENEIKCKIIRKVEVTTEPNVNITLFQGIPKFEKMELIIQKNTELGVKKFVPVMMERTVVKLDSKSMQKKLQRWQKISETAAKQSMRDMIPQVKEVVKLKDIDFSEYDKILVAYENEENNMLKTELNKIKDENRIYNIAVVIGPEGGISEKEIEILKQKDASFVSLGKRILRTETAGIVICGNIMYELD